MIEDVRTLINMDFEELKGSSFVLKLLKVYSFLYLYSKSPNVCEKCLRKYYEQLKINGMKKAFDYEEIKNRTCIPKWRGLKYFTALAKHVSNELITDKEAIELLENKLLREKDFEKLPDGYKKNIEIIPQNDTKNLSSELPKQSVKKQTRKRKPVKKSK